MNAKTFIALVSAASITAVAADKVEVNQLPQPVLKTLNASKGTDAIKEIERETQDGRTVYEVEFSRQGFNPKLVIAEDGSVVRDTRKEGGLLSGAPRSREDKGAYADTSYLPAFPRVSSLQLADLPPAVQKAIQQHGGGRKVADIDRETWNGRPVYEVEFAQAGRNQQIHLSEDGTLIRDNRAGESLNKLLMGTQLEDTPSAVQETIRREMGNAQIADIDKERRTGQTIYEVEFAGLGRPAELHIGENGAVVKDSRREGTLGTSASGNEIGRSHSSAVDSQEVTLSELPAAVQNAIRASDDDRANVKRIHRRTRVVYDVELEKAGKNTRIEVAEDGTILKDNRQ